MNGFCEESSRALDGKRKTDVFKTLNKLQISGFDNLATASQYWRVYDSFLEHVSPGSQVLDWGCGNGHFSYFLLNCGFRTESFNVNASDSYNPGGCKLSDFLREQFKDAFSFKISSGGPVYLPYEDESLDAVVSVGVLEHVRQEGGDEIKSLQEIHRILKKDGLFLCFHFPNKYSWVEAIARRIPAKHHHPYTFTRKNIISLNQAAGLALEKVEGYAILPRNELSRLPERIKNSAWFVKTYNAADKILRTATPPIFQNYYFLSRKRK